MGKDSFSLEPCLLLKDPGSQLSSWVHFKQKGDMIGHGN